MLFVPLCYFAYGALLDSGGRLTRAGVVRSVCVGVGAHAILMAALVAASAGKKTGGVMVVGEGFVCFTQFASSALTLFVRRPL